MSGPAGASAPPQLPPSGHPIYNIQFAGNSVVAPPNQGPLKTLPTDLTDISQQWEYNNGQLQPKSESNKWASVPDSSVADTPVQSNGIKYSWNVDINKATGTILDPNSELSWIVKKGHIVLGPEGSVFTFKRVDDA